MRRLWLMLAAALLLSGCAGGPGGSGGGRYAASQDGYPDAPRDVSRVPDAVPKVEPRSRSGNRPTYRVWGKTYHVLSDPSGYVAEGRASFYGTKFQGYDTASGEPYDMYKMSAAHRSLPLPTYARVTNLDNGRQVIVRINDRGPFHDDRLIDLSYAAAARLDILGHGTGRVRVEAIDPVAWAKTHGGSRSGPRVAAAPAAPARVAGTAQTSAAPRRNDPLSTAVDRAAAASDPGTRAAVAAPGPVTQTGMTQTRVAQGARGVRYLQVAALGSQDKALALQSRLQDLLSQPVRIDNSASLYRVQVGPIDDLASLETVRATLSDAGFGQTFVVSPTQ
ncbi:septal ring lytic transglycosylase RlpA family protein [Salinicola sp. DM10]|uniref:septal ring lytic transglycosylase RlpA family protein n=1 Tax=Salinicola sp. DM10 TaxID=2815721 RepID=UPI001A8C01C2|nr:septal ring lytic transglycosylase RlpA family protein [Salinicola sp. DM10]